MARLQSVTAALSRALPRAGVLDTITTQAIAAMDATMAAVLEVSEDGKDFLLAHSIGLDAAAQKRWARLPVDNPYPPGEVARTQMPIFLESAEEWLAGFKHPDKDRPNYDGAWAVLPLLIGDEVRGLINLSWPTPRTFSQVDRQFMLALAG